VPDPTGDFPFLNAVLDGVAFSGQQASFGDDDVGKLWLHGKPECGEAGIVTGYSGGFRWAFAQDEQESSDPQNDGQDPQFSSRLDAALRRPLGRIIANADEIAAQEDGALREDYAGYAGDIAVAGRHLLGLVDDLSDLQAVERPGFRVDTERLDLADVARRAASLLGVRASDRNVQIDPPDTDETLWAKADFRRALQIMVNLVGNAVRYSPPESMVWIRAEEEGDIVALIVADQGKGIAIEDQERIFEKFERVDTSEPGGSGLGLYISRQLARAMGGDISVDSAPGLGARFVLTLPAAS
jgi:signal transduction histidine kinase